MVSLDAGKAQSPFGRSRAGKPAMALTVAAAAVVDTSQPSATRAHDLRAFLSWAVSTGAAQLATVNFQPLPPSIVTLSDAQIARSKAETEL
jgi:ABC-type phosphate transport system substrate-binding protein